MKINPDELLVTAKKVVIPALSKSMHKGQAGIIGVMGGCFEYTGAPYYSATSALKCGADLAMVFCTEAAAVPIKSYSPELIVHPIIASKGSELTPEQSVNKLSKIITRLTALVIGPGLGRDPVVMETTEKVIHMSKNHDIPLILDGDALWLLSQKKDLIDGHKHCVLLPNVPEFKRLQTEEDQTAESLSKQYKATVVQKQEKDRISCGDMSTICTATGSSRRCGGQGDVLAGSVGVFMGWAHKQINKESAIPMNDDQKTKLKLSACLAACTLVKDCNRSAFEKHYRGTTTIEIINEIPNCFHDLFEPEL